ncbi:hypothetical protein [Pseudodesulfovibrio tunisiensis]|uniref:hypothetical protein n=1 Tax=Pseudodesulfovibrio tunisiensis TaxID=463192 RepID=UPI001FB567AD|nr:hypothetical protein [Pseudodesulfovibrio tunisiensis]
MAVLTTMDGVSFAHIARINAHSVGQLASCMGMEWGFDAYKHRWAVWNFATGTTGWSDDYWNELHSPNGIATTANDAAYGFLGADVTAIGHKTLNVSGNVAASSTVGLREISTHVWTDGGGMTGKVVRDVAIAVGQPFSFSWTPPATVSSWTIAGPCCITFVKSDAPSNNLFVIENLKIWVTA